MQLQIQTLEKSNTLYSQIIFLKEKIKEISDIQLEINGLPHEYKEEVLAVLKSECNRLQKEFDAL